jgi:tRNA(Met) C34 N-acetyltransferase TmcA
MTNDRWCTTCEKFIPEPELTFIGAQRGGRGKSNLAMSKGIAHLVLSKKESESRRRKVNVVTPEVTAVVHPTHEDSER